MRTLFFPLTLSFLLLACDDSEASTTHRLDGSLDIGVSWQGDARAPHDGGAHVDDDGSLRDANARSDAQIRDTTIRLNDASGANGTESYLASADACGGASNFACTSCALNGTYRLIRTVGAAHCDSFIVDGVRCTFATTGRTLTIQCPTNVVAGIYSGSIDTTETSLYTESNTCGARSWIRFPGIAGLNAVSVVFGVPNTPDASLRRVLTRHPERVTIRTGGELIGEACQYNLEP